MQTKEVFGKIYVVNARNLFYQYFVFIIFSGVIGRIAVALAASEFATRTCVRFVPRTNETDYVEIIRGGG